MGRFRCSADLVLTFRNVRNRIQGDFEVEAFEAFYAMLKPGGVPGGVEHRAPPAPAMTLTFIEPAR